MTLLTAYILGFITPIILGGLYLFFVIPWEGGAAGFYEDEDGEHQTHEDK